MRRCLGILAAPALVAAAALLGPLPAHADTLGHPASSAAATSWFNWVDHASPGMVNDNIHIVNPGTAGASGTITVPGLWSANFQVAAGGATFVAVPGGIIGGPATVQVTSGPPVIATQRIQYYSSFSEIAAATSANAVSHAWFPWYDRASPGTTNDNIHVMNPGATTATGTFVLTGAAPLSFTVPAGQEAYFNFPFGTINGPLRVDVNSGPPVVVSQRVQYSGSFNEVLALDAAAAQQDFWFDWFDNASPGVVTDNLHVVNPGPATASVSASAPGLAAVTISVPPGEQRFFSWGGQIGGPVHVTATAPVLVTQRLQWPPTFAEWPGRATTEAAVDTWFPWYDDATSGMVDDVHVTNPGTIAASVNLLLTGYPAVTLSVAPQADVHYAYPRGTIGGPLHVQVTSGPPVLVTQRAFLMPPPTSRTLNVPLYHQAYALSCEEAALRMALAYQGINVSEDQILNTMGIDYRAPVRDASGFHWGDPYAKFVGDPNGSEVNNTGYGSYNEAIARTAGALGGSVLASGEQMTPAYLYQSILDGHPVVAWVPFDWSPHNPSFYTAFDGRWIRFGSPYEHAVAVIGVNQDAVLVNNPWQGQQWVSKGTFEAAYATFNNMAVVLR